MPAAASSYRVRRPCAPTESRCPVAFTASGKPSERILPLCNSTLPVKPSSTSVVVPVPLLTSAPPPASAPDTSEDVATDTQAFVAMASVPTDVCRAFFIHFFHR